MSVGRSIVVLCIVLAMVLATGGTGWRILSTVAEAEEGEQKLPLGAAPARAWEGRETEEKVHFEGIEYAGVEGANSLAQLIRTASDERRKRALVAIRGLRDTLQGTDAVRELTAVYKDETLDTETRGAALRALVASRDPHTLGVFHEALTDEDNEVLRALVAVGLASMNVRPGVSELVRLTMSDAEVGNQRALAPLARDELRLLNRRNGWGFPVEMAESKVQECGGYSRKECGAIFATLWQNWFDENQHRFPEWKPGDPLPEVETEEEATERNEGQ